MAQKAFPYFGYLALAGGGGYLAKATLFLSGGDDATQYVELQERVPSRSKQLARLREANAERPFDVLVVGGGATGTGIALDASTRGLKTALIEREDFGSGTSSKSTKLVHGGVRYLEKAVFNADYGQLKLVFEALRERKSFLDNAPHLSTALPILMPCYKWWEVPFYWSGLKTYDALAGTRNLAWSKYLTPSESLRRLPTLKEEGSEGRSLKGTILYYDGQFDDARMNVALACTAAAADATVVNYMDCKQLILNSEGEAIGVRCVDRIDGGHHDVYARVIINSTGPYVDQLRQASHPGTKALVMPSSGAHVTLPDYYGALGVGMIIPKTKDGRVVFLLPWQGHVIAGTTDNPAALSDHPRATKNEVAFILEALSDYLSVPVHLSDVSSTWSGLRPLAAVPDAAHTSSVSRDHLIVEEADGSVTVTGGKWTTYRLMAEEVVDKAVSTGRLPPAGPCVTHRLPVLGARGYHRNYFIEVAQSNKALHHPLATNVARHLAGAYGTQAKEVLRIASERKLHQPLVEGQPVLEAEVIYCVKNEYCQKIEDFLCRRTRIGFLDVAAAKRAVPRVAELMGAELEWSLARRKKEVEAALAYLASFEMEP